jgi:hypothetical protein
MEMPPLISTVAHDADQDLLPEQHPFYSARRRIRLIELLDALKPFIPFG